MKNIFLILLFLLTLPTLSFSKTITGKTISVADGDTITILNNHNQQTKIRLPGIIRKLYSQQPRNNMKVCRTGRELFKT